MGLGRSPPKHLQQQQFRERMVLRIIHHGQAVGAVALMRLPDHIRSDDIYPDLLKLRLNIGSKDRKRGGSREAGPGSQSVA
jgi:hypothetical protein